ncbi:hypothetical protein LTR94_022814 [Friedmanniomyces endolithicus]|nr:hypothetical protein LTR94_022814 [Friedmanniomyces endolithicus]
MRIFRKLHQKLNWTSTRYVGVVVGLLALTYLTSAVYHSVKPLPDGLDYTGKLRHADVKFIADQTYIDAQGKQKQDHHIFDTVFKLIEDAQTTIVLDMFLFNDEVGTSQVSQRALTRQLTDALIVKRSLHPNIEIKVITDPINSVYGGLLPEHYRKLRQAGNNPDGGWLKNPFGDEKITLRSYLNLFNFKANHRKTLVVDTAEGWKTLVTSANPHDGSSRHSNVALLVTGNTAIDVLKTEQTVAHLSQGDVPMVILGEIAGNPSQPQVQVLTEKAILDATLNLLNTAKANDQIDLAMFYLSERQIINALKDAQKRGVKLRILLDPNKDAFGRQKNGIPNRQVASELNDAGITVRWCNTQGEQCHSKMILKRHAQEAELILGSANFTARNLKNYNLETNLRVIGQSNAAVFTDAQQYFDGAWSNLNGRQMSVGYEQYKDESKLKYGLYRFMEWSGLSTF